MLNQTLLKKSKTLDTKKKVLQKSDKLDFNNKKIIKVLKKSNELDFNNKKIIKVLKNSNKLEIFNNKCELDIKDKSKIIQSQLNIKFKEFSDNEKNIFLNLFLKKYNSINILEESIKIILSDQIINNKLIYFDIINHILLKLILLILLVKILIILIKI